MKVVIKRVGEAAAIAEIGATLEAMQAVVGGLIQPLDPGIGGRLVMYCNEEGRIFGFEPNIAHPRYGIIVGTVLVVGMDHEDDTDVPENRRDEVCAWLDQLAIGGGGPKRDEATILRDVAATYSALSPENLHQDGEASAHHVQREGVRLHKRLRALFRELGRQVPESEAYQAA